MRSIFTIIISLSILSKAFSQETNWHYSSRCSTNYSFEAIDNQVRGVSIFKVLVTPAGKAIKDSTILFKPLGFGLDEIAAKQIERKFFDIKDKSIKKPIWYVVPIEFYLGDITLCERSDYCLFKGNQAINNGYHDIAIKFFVDAINLDRNNLMALKNLCILRFSSGKDLVKAQIDWKKLYRDRFISEEEYIKYKKS